MKVIGYLRVSTADQDTEKNKKDIRAFANEKGLPRVEWVEEKVSTAIHWKKRRLNEVIESLQEGDSIIVPELSRFARSTLQILEIIKVCKEKGLNVYAVKGGWSLNGTIESKVLLTVFAMVAEIEKDLISLRTKEGLAAARAKGKVLGRPPGPGKSKLDPHRTEIIALLRTGSKKTYISEKFGVTAATLLNWTSRHGIDTRSDLKI